MSESKIKNKLGELYISSNMQRSSEEIAGNIDLLTEILVRVPAKPLLRFICVSKQWLALISDSQFCHSHTLFHHTPHSNPCALLLNHDFSPSPHFQIVPLTNSETDPSVVKVPCLDYLNVPRILIMESCNGLMLCSTAFLMKLDDQITFSISVEGKRFKISYAPFPLADNCASVLTDNGLAFRYFLCNPTTKQYTVVTFPTEEFGRQLVTLSLAFDPLRSPHYKVISIRTVKDRTKSRGNGQKLKMINVYSSETGSWSEDVCFTAPPSISFHVGVYFKCAIHWYTDSDQNSVYFDVDTQCLKTYPMPPPDNEDLSLTEVGYFGESMGHLHVVFIDRFKNVEFDILELKEDYSGWVLRYHVDLTPTEHAFPELVWDLRDKMYSFSVLCIVRQAKEEDSVVVLFVDGRAMYFNLVDHTSRKLCDLEPCMATAGTAALDYEHGDAFQYIESLSYVRAFAC